jgi:subtilisin-like proprotein convertase family protein
MITACSCLATPPNPSTFSNSSAIAVNDSASPPTKAALYPSTVTVSGLTGIVAKVSVQINSLSHAFPDDIDILLVAPSGQRAVIFADAGGSTAVSNLTITLDDDAPSALPDNGPLVSGIFQPTNYAPADAFPSLAPSPGPATALSTFRGENPNGTWSLYVVDDQTGNAGTIAGGWNLTITTGISVTNAATVTINDSANPPTIATPYPSIISVSNLVGEVDKVTVRLLGVAHDFADDVDILLAGPQGQNVILWGGAGGTGPINNVNVTLDDNAPSSVPDLAAVTSGTYKPSNYGTGFGWPSLPTNVVVVQTSTPMLSALNGTDPNGDWSLYVVDHSPDGAGNIVGGWILSIAATPSPTLNLQLAGTNVILSWPAIVQGYTLQSTTSLATSNSWTTVTPAPTYVSGQNFVTNALDGSNRFYRLKK